MPYLGESAALSCSLFWALCSIAFASAGRRIGATAVNQIRIYMALVALGVLHLALVGSIWPAGVSDRQLWLLLVSGFIGLAIGDLCLFLCMTAIGPRLGTLLMATSPAMTAAIAWQWLDEAIGVAGLAGMALILIGVAAVLSDRRSEEGWRAPAQMSPIVAVLLGLGGALGQAVGLILAKDGMAAFATEETAIEPLSATLVRMAAGALGMVVIAIVSGHARRTMRAFQDRRAIGTTAVGAVFGPILGVWMSAVAVAYADAGVAATLMSLAPVLMLPIARVAYGARPGPAGILGTLLAVIGCAALFLREAS